MLIVVDDLALAELLAEALVDAGHTARQMTMSEVLDGTAGKLSTEAFDAAIVDLDSWMRSGIAVVTHLQRESPATTVIALLPCGARPSDFAEARYHVGLEKPARIKALLAAVQAPGLNHRE